MPARTPVSGVAVGRATPGRASSLVAHPPGLVNFARPAEDAKVEGTEQTRIYVGVDGVKVRTVPQAEKDKRRHEQSRIHTHAFATNEDHMALGQMLGEQAEAIGWAGATQRVSLTDGAPWIRNQILKHLQPIDAMLPDFYHFSEHVWATAHVCLGQGQAAETWAQEQLTAIKEAGPRPVLAAIDGLRKKMRSPGKLDSLRLQRKYIVARWEMVDYRLSLARGVGYRARANRSHV